MSYANSPKENVTAASYVTNGSVPGRSVWDLTPYQGPGIGSPGGTWRLIEVGFNLLYAQGTIAADGSLTGLPSSYETPYSYDGFMELQLSEPPETCTACPCTDEKEECKCQSD